mgnify:FL=1
MNIQEILKIATLMGKNDEFKIKNIEDNKEYFIEQFTSCFDEIKDKHVITLYVRGKNEWKQSGNGRLKK